MAIAPKTMTLKADEMANEIMRTGQKLIELSMALRAGIEFEIVYKTAAEKVDPL